MRIAAACKLNGTSYSQFISGLKKAGMELDRKILADIAVHDAAGFTKLVEQAKAAQPPKAKAKGEAGKGQGCVTRDMTGGNAARGSKGSGSRRVWMRRPLSCRASCKADASRLSAHPLHGTMTSQTLWA